MIESAGLVLIHNNKIFLEHPTGAKWYGSYSFPKGHIDEGETAPAAAIRETYEEIGILFEVEKLQPIAQGYIDYESMLNQVYKRVHYFVIELDIPVNPKDCKLQLEEVDWVGWLTKEEATKRIFWRLKDVLQYLK